ncbi:hypothetical protein M427DRAFT_71504 [Gonapodya prolifera JEL478]|uniref:Cora-domain-containing protein n=1 Tax=Gonapodya prolifera (strain JEL478) TaxID=1344416 RepID=A0A139A9E0_GONPJ|nr:hypothetical protein M427DRAFT_71504 [Gonapodya prolifera JEL478]|eukprot:KXS13279.1 hypothetical protein M427DRAFT_71504 [Gonapodya prolifera JEL478]
MASLPPATNQSFAPHAPPPSVQPLIPVDPLNPLPATQVPRWGVADFVVGEAGRFSLGQDAESLSHYVSSQPPFQRESVRWAHVATAGLPTDEQTAFADVIRSMANYPTIAGRTPRRHFQKQALTIDENGVTLAIPVFAEDRVPPTALAIGAAPTASSTSPLLPTTNPVPVQPTVSVSPTLPPPPVLSRLAFAESRLLKRGRLALRLEFVRGWRADDIRFLLVTHVEGMWDLEMQEEMLGGQGGNGEGGLMKGANAFPDGPSLVAQILRAHLEISAEVVTFIEEAFADAERLVFRRPSTGYSQVLTALKAELLGLRRDFAVVCNQVAALGSFLRGVAPSGSAWTGSITNLEAVASEGLVIDSRILALIERTDALVGLVNYEVTAYQNRIIFALTIFTVLFAPTNFFVTFVKAPFDIVLPTQNGFWAALVVLFFLTLGLLTFMVGPSKVFEDLHEALVPRRVTRPGKIIPVGVRFGRDLDVRSHDVFFERLEDVVGQENEFQKGN